MAISPKLPLTGNILDELRKPITRRVLFLSNGAEVVVNKYSRKWTLNRDITVVAFLVNETVSFQFLNEFLA